VGTEPEAREAPAEQTPLGEDALGTARYRVVLVDDEPSLVGVLGELFEQHGYRATTFTDPHVALAMLLDESTPVDLLMADLTMPDLSGLELAEYMAWRGENCPIILCTGRDIAIDPATQ
jgi:DNA-binding response OmpR family regulator